MNPQRSNKPNIQFISLPVAISYNGNRACTASSTTWKQIKLLGTPPSPGTRAASSILFPSCPDRLAGFTVASADPRDHEPMTLDPYQATEGRPWGVISDTE